MISPTAQTCAGAETTRTSAETRCPGSPQAGTSADATRTGAQAPDTGARTAATLG